jgi:hypothetical protein
MKGSYRRYSFCRAFSLRGVCFLAVSVCTMIWGALGRTEAPIQLLMPGTFHQKEVSAEDGEEWLALTKDSKGTRLVKVQITVKPVSDIWDREGEATGKKVAVENLS